MAYPVIATKLLKATTYRGNRIKAWWDFHGYNNSKNEAITLPWDYSLDGFANHSKAAEALARKIWYKSLESGEDIRLIAGGIPYGYVFIREYYSQSVEINP